MKAGLNTMIVLDVISGLLAGANKRKGKSLLERIGTQFTLRYWPANPLILSRGLFASGYCVAARVTAAATSKVGHRGIRTETAERPVVRIGRVLHKMRAALSAPYEMGLHAQIS